MLPLWILVVIAVSTLTIAWMWGWKIRCETKHWSMGNGQFESRLREQRQFLNHYRFSYIDASGQARYFTMWTLWAGDIRLGDNIPLILNPLTKEARVNRFAFLYAHPLELAIGGLFILGVSGLALLTHP